MHRMHSRRCALSKIGIYLFRHQEPNAERRNSNWDTLTIKQFQFQILNEKRKALAGIVLIYNVIALESVFDRFVMFHVCGA